VNPWFGTGSVTVTTTGEDGVPTAAPILLGFKVSKNAEGKIDITASDEIKSIMDDIFADLPPCPGKLRKRQSCPARLQAAADAFSEHIELRPAFQQLATDLANEAGGAQYAAELAANNQALGFAVNDQAELEALVELLFPGVSLDTVAAGVDLVVTSASYFAAVWAIWSGAEQVWYKLSAGMPQVYAAAAVVPAIATETTSACPNPAETPGPVRPGET
jgi:hypothetical protein